MIFSKYCTIYPDKDNPGSVIVFSTKRASKISVPESILQDIRQGNLTEEERQTLADLGFLPKSEDEDRAEVSGFIDEYNRIDRYFSAQLVMNLDCNLDCGYCFEGSRKGKFYMTDETAAGFVDFIKNRLLLRPVSDNNSAGGRTEELSIAFYGGEPLLSLDMVLSLSNAVKSVAAERGIEYKGKVVTNGTLLLRKTAERLAAAGIKTASITLDGPESVHDLSRPFKGGKGSFKVIAENLREVCDMIGLDIGGNYTKENYRQFPGLFDQLADCGLTPEKVSSLQFYPVIQEAGGIVNPDFNDGYTSINEPWVFDAEVFLRGELLRRGYKSSRLTPTTCMMDLKNRIIVNYDGRIYKCSGMIGREEYSVGDIKSGTLYDRQPQGRDVWKNEKCLACEYLPLCFGGCRYSRLVREGDMDGVDCKRPYLDATLEALVKQDIKYGLMK